MSVEEMLEYVNDTINVGCGLISYRKHTELLKAMILKLNMLHEYRRSVVEEITKEIDTIDTTIREIKGKIKEALLVDESIPSNKNGGKTVQLPDVATLSMTKENTTVVFSDPDKVLEQLGDDYTKIVKKLDSKKAKQFILNNNEPVEGSEIVIDRTLRINFK